MFRVAVLVLAVIGSGASVATAQVDGDAPALQRMHEAFVEAFVESDGFGPRRVTPMMVQMRRYEFDGIGDSGRCVHDVELIGIARHDPPLVHAGRFMGFQHANAESGQAPGHPTRDLSGWESDMLGLLASGQSLVVHDVAGSTRAMGPIRARGECLACHARAREGDLLGALSYGLGRIETPPGNPERRFCRQ
ncbi:hypothetical protein [Pseudoxanthomonas putridarboris]|uniref:DUF3365 domain-containing protein n=1 Tax=Pseudoxanthomonas putridarboris TaxID=752605 RepID=A0ABU9IXD9_9GAMM